MTEPTPLIPPRKRSRRPVWFDVVSAAVAVAVLGAVLSRSDLSGAFKLIAGTGPKAALVLLPFAVTMAVDALAHNFLFSALGVKVKYAPLYLVRLAVEAVSLSLPAGAVFAETVNPVLLKKRCGIPYHAGIVGNLAKRWLTTLSQTGYMALSAWLGYRTLCSVSTALGLGRGLFWTVLGSAVLLLTVSLAMGAALSGKTWPRRFWRVLHAIPGHWWHRWLEGRRAGLAAADARLSRLAGRPRALVAPGGLLLVGWILESVETLVILRVLGAPIGFPQVIAFEAGLALVRHVAFFVPAGLGIQDLGYLTFLKALGLPGAASVSAAFVVLKRAKEILWIGFGYGLLLILRWAPRAPMVNEAAS